MKFHGFFYVFALVLLEQLNKLQHPVEAKKPKSKYKITGDMLLFNKSKRISDINTMLLEFIITPF